MPNAPSPRSPRSLAVREHGAYFQLGAPLVAVLLAARPTAAALCLALGAAAVFSAHEPLLVLLGHRGTRARREDAARAWPTLVAGVVGGVGLAIAAAILAPATLPSMSVPVVLGATALAFTLRQRERTLGGELVASAALTFAALPTAIANGLPTRVGVGVCGVFYAFALLSTVEVRAVARRDAGQRGRRLAWALAVGLLLAFGIAAPPFALAMVPTVVTLAVVAAVHPTPKHLRRVGWALAASSLLTAGSAVVAARLLA